MSRDPVFLKDAKRMVKGMKMGCFWANPTKPLSTLDAVDIIKHALSFAWENGRLE